MPSRLAPSALDEAELVLVDGGLQEVLTICPLDEPRGELLRLRERIESLLHLEDARAALGLHDEPLADLLDAPVVVLAVSVRDAGQPSVAVAGEEARGLRGELADNTVCTAHGLPHSSMRAGAMTVSTNVGQKPTHIQPKPKRATLAGMVTVRGLIATSISSRRKRHARTACPPS